MTIKKLTSIVLCFALLYTMIPIVNTTAEAYAENSESFELYSLEIEADKIALNGRFFEQAKGNLFFELKKENIVVASNTTISNSDGSFSFEIPVKTENIAYTINVTAENGTKGQWNIDLSPHTALYNLGKSAGYRIYAVSYENDAVFLRGTHSGIANGVTTLRVMNGTNLATVSQDVSDENKNFEIEFKTHPGTYTMYLMAEGSSQVSCEYTEVSFANIFEKDRGSGENVSLLTNTLREYVTELENLTKNCHESGITTDYEDAYIAIIDEFISNIENEVSLGLYERLGQYYYTFKPLYLETRDTLEKYLSGEKTPLTVSRFKTGKLEFNGVEQRATLERNGVESEKPVYFVGYGHWETAAEKISLFEKLGFNIVTTEVMMWDVIVPGVFKGWTDNISKSNPAEFSLSDKTKVSGDYSFKIENEAQVSEYNNYRMLSQKIKAKPNTTYTFGLKAKGKGILPVDETRNEMAVWFSLNGLNSAGRQKIDNSDDWISYDAEYTTGAKEETLDLTILSAFGVEELYIDDVYVKEKETDFNLVVNGGFDDVTQPRTDVEKLIRDKGWFINYDRLDYLEGVLKDAEEHNMLVDMCLCLGFMPSFIMESDSESQRHKEYFLPFVMENNTMKEASVLWARLMGETLVKYDSVHSLCLLNEPEVHANGKSMMEGHSYDDGYYIPYWQAYLQNKYKDITKLNLCYGTNYKKFEDVAMPTGLESTPIFYDYREFNDGILTDYIEWISGEVKKYFPDIAVHTKMMDYFMYAYPRFIQNGANFEKMAQFTDINGCDGFSTYRYTSYNYTKAPLELKMGWYDYMISIKEAPVWDTESHISNDYPVPEYDDLVPYYTSADVWNGAIHGRGAQIIWLWDLRRGSLPESWSNYPNANAVLRPADVIQVSKTAFDLNRLSEEISALQKEEARVGLLYSRTSLGYNDNYMNECDAAYRDIIFSGQKAGFVTDTNPSDMHKYELLVVPEATNVSADMISEIKKYIENGGKVVLTGSSSLGYDEYNKSHNKADLYYIYMNSDSFTPVDKKIRELNMSEIVIKDADTGLPVEDVEWTYTTYGGRYLVNILNYTKDDTKNLRIFANGKEMKNIKELRTDSVSESGIIVAKPYQPQLLEIQINTFDVVDENGNIIKENISKLQNGIIRYNTSAEGSEIYALYKDDVLIKVSVGSDTIDISATESGNYRLEAMIWDVEKMQPLSVRRDITMEVEQ